MTSSAPHQTFANALPHQARSSVIDLAKGICILLVVIWHTQAITLLRRGEAGLLVDLAIIGQRAFYFFGTLLAVPTFFFLSLYLYAQHRRTQPDYLRRRLFRLAVIFVAWSLAWTAFVALCSGSSPEVRPLHFFMGGPPLPPVGDSVLYFVSNLALLTILLEALLSLSPGTAVRLATGLLLLLAFAFCWFLFSGIRIPFWLPVSFLPAVPLVVLADAGRLFPGRRQWLLPLLGFSVAVALEIAAIAHHDRLPSTYARPSPWIGGLLLLQVLRSSRPGACPSFERLGRRTLGIFVLHKFPLALLVRAIEPQILWLGGLGMRVDLLLVAILTMLATITLVWVLRKTPARWVV